MAEYRLKRFFECLIPVTACNLKCGYCYVIQRDNRKMEMPSLKYTPEHMGKGLTQDRLGGICYFSICGAGETLLPEDTVRIAYELLKNGHFVNITTNGTITKRIEEILQFPHEYLQRLHFSFSLHYNELVRLKLLDRFFENVQRVCAGGCSFLVQINLCDEYLECWDEIKALCVEKVGAAPQVAATRKERNDGGRINRVEYMTSLSDNNYIAKGAEFKSPLFEFTIRNFNKKRKEFCYAGDWTGTLNLGTGILSKCYSPNKQDIFADISKPINFVAIGKCNSLFCMNSSHFMSLGVIPELNCPTYAELRNRAEAGWYTETMQAFLNQKLYDNNNLYTDTMKNIALISTYIQSSVSNVKYHIKRLILKVWK